MNAADNLRAAAEALRDALASYDRVADAFRHGAEQRDLLVAEIERDRVSINTDDDDALGRLAAKQTKLDIIKARIPNDDVLPPLVRQLRELLQTLPDLMRVFLNPEMLKLRDQIEAELLPMIPDPGARLQAVNGNAAVHKLWVLMSCFWRLFPTLERPVETARQVLAEVDGLLSGATPWLDAK